MRCIICNSIIEKELFNKAGSKYYLCEKCFSLQQNVKRFNSISYNNFDYSVGFKREKEIRNRAKTIIKELLLINNKITSILDIGCGAGFLLDEFNKKFEHVVGIEPSKKLMEYAVKHYNLKIYNYYFSSKTVNKIKEKYDVVIMSHIIEHITNPIEFVRNAYLLLNKNGILYIETPNINSWLANIEKSDFTFLTPKDHVCLYSRKSMISLVKNSNIVCKRIISYTYSDIEHVIGIIIKLKNLLLSYLKKNGSNGINTRYKKTAKMYPRKTDCIINAFCNIFLKPLMNLFYKGTYLVFYIQKEG